MIPKIASLGLLALVPTLDTGAADDPRRDEPVTDPQQEEQVPPRESAEEEVLEVVIGKEIVEIPWKVVALEAGVEPPPPADPWVMEGPLLQIRAREILVGDGTRIANGVLVIQNGRIVKIGSDVAVDEAHPVIDHDGVVSAGMIACQALSGMGGEASETARSILPEARIAYAFHPSHSDFEKALASGITTLVLSPTSDNLVGGLTAVVKSAGGKVVDAEAHLALSFASAALRGGVQEQNFRFFSADTQYGEPESTESGVSGSRYPTSYSGAVRELNERFANPEGILARVAKGELPVLIEAWERHEVARAASFARRFGLRGAIRGAPLAGDEHLLGLLKASGLSVILGPFGFGQSRRSLDSISALQKEGVPVAFALGASGGSPELLRVSAAMAVSAGADAAGVWKALTSDAARIAGVDGRVGVLVPGKDADFVLWSGNPLNLTSRVQAVYVDGERAYDGASR